MINKLAIVTGGNGDMGSCITRAVAAAGYRVIMACNNPESGEPLRQQIIQETKNPHIEIEQLELRDLQNVVRFTERIEARKIPVALLMNNAGVMPPKSSITQNGFNHTVSVNYIAPFLLTLRLLSSMERNSRIVNMISCTYAIGKIKLPQFFETGGCKHYHRIPVYSNTKLALLLFTLELSKRIKERGITVNAADPGIVSTKFIVMEQWLDPLTDIFFRPFIKKPQQGAATAIHLLLNPQVQNITGAAFADCKEISLSTKYKDSPLQKELWDATYRKIAPFLDKEKFYRSHNTATLQ